MHSNGQKLTIDYKPIFNKYLCCFLAEYYTFTIGFVQGNIKCRNMIAYDSSDFSNKLRVNEWLNLQPL